MMPMEFNSGTGDLIYSFAEKLYPICRSITGDGLRQTLKILQSELPLVLHEVPTGTPVLDWTIPKEWNIKEAWVKGPNGDKIIDFRNHNLHILNYSIPVHAQMDLQELKKHLFSLPEQPDLIPYRTSYYKENWGFCLAHRQLEQLPDGTYEVFIDSSLKKGSLTYGELFIPGKLREEILFSAHVCHPSLANDNLSGIGLLTQLAKQLLEKNNRYSFRFLFIPGTIGSIAWLALNEEKIKNIKAGLVASLLGDSGSFTYKKSRRGDTEIDRIVSYVLSHSNKPYSIKDFFPYGYDERQFCSPGFNLAVGNLTRSQFGEYPEYHTSGDNLDLIQPIFLEESFQLFEKVVKCMDQNKYYRNLQPKGEPQLGKRGLYEAIGGQSDQKQLQLAMLWILNMADGQHSLLDIAIQSGIAFDLLHKISQILEKKELIEEIP